MGSFLLCSAASVIPLMLPIRLVLGWKSSLPTLMLSWGWRDPAVVLSWQINCLIKIQGFPHNFFSWLFVSLLWNRWFQLDSPQMSSLACQTAVYHLFEMPGQYQRDSGWRIKDMVQSKQCVVALQLREDTGKWRLPTTKWNSVNLLVLL